MAARVVDLNLDTDNGPVLACAAYASDVPTQVKPKAAATAVVSLLELIAIAAPDENITGAYLERSIVALTGTV